MRLKFIGIYNTKSLNTRPNCIVIDELLALDAGSLATGLTFAEQQKIRGILISHGHYDHISDIPAFAFNTQSHTTKVFGTKVALDILVTHLMDGIIYPRFTETLIFAERSVLELCQLEPLHFERLDGYQIKVLPLDHSSSSVGFEVIAEDKKSILYTGDTGKGLSAIWPHVNPDILIVDLTFPDELENVAVDSKHMCPQLLSKELVNFNKIKGYFPTVIPIHFDPRFEYDIKKQMDEIARKLGISIINVREGIEVNV